MSPHTKKKKLAKASQIKSVVKYRKSASSWCISPSNLKVWNVPTDPSQVKYLLVMRLYRSPIVSWSSFTDPVKESFIFTWKMFFFGCRHPVVVISHASPAKCFYLVSFTRNCVIDLIYYTKKNYHYSNTKYCYFFCATMPFLIVYCIYQVLKVFHIIHV